MLTDEAGAAVRLVKREQRQVGTQELAGTVDKAGAG